MPSFASEQIPPCQNVSQTFWAFRAQIISTKTHIQPIFGLLVRANTSIGNQLNKAQPKKNRAPINHSRMRRVSLILVHTETSGICRAPIPSKHSTGQEQSRELESSSPPPSRKSSSNRNYLQNHLPPKRHPTFRIKGCQHAMRDLQSTKHYRSQNYPRRSQRQGPDIAGSGVDGGTKA